MIRPAPAAFFLFLMTAAAACGASSLAHQKPVILATTTSVNDSGLLDALVPDFEAASGYAVKTIAVGSGKALAMGERGEADVLLVHAPQAEQELLAGGKVVDRRPVMHNYFVLVGPPADPAGIQGVKSATSALRRIADARATFVSRGDDSGTHRMEQSLWSDAGHAPSGAWYLETGQGMGATLVIASEKEAYTLTDLGTYHAFLSQLRLDVMVAESASLLNVYSVLVVNPESFPGANASGARAFADYLLSPRAQEIIRGFGVERFGSPLFVPDGGRTYSEIAG